MRYFIHFCYNGTRYFGWQSQPDTPNTVQETLQKVISTLLRTPIEITGAGRTDSGVHAKNMYAHFDFDLEIDWTNFVHRINSFLPEDIAVYEVIPVEDEAHARFDATKRTYEYHIHTFKNPFLEELSWYYHKELDIESMNAACQILFQHIDFECFSKVNTDVRTFNCSITQAHWERKGERLIFTISADRFLRNMVRAIVGTMIQVGIGKCSLTDFEQIILSKNRSKAGFSVPAKGLFLTEVSYPYLK